MTTPFDEPAVYDPALPILAELEHHVRTMALAADAARAGAAADVDGAAGASSTAGANGTVGTSGPVGASSTAGAANPTGVAGPISAGTTVGTARDSSTASTADGRVPVAASAEPRGAPRRGSPARAIRAARPAHAPAPSSTAPERTAASEPRRMRVPSRLLRRGAILALLGCTVGATATALTRPEGPDPAEPIVAREGHAGPATWRFEVARREGRLCPTLFATGPTAPAASLATDCVAAPSARELLPTTALTTERAVVAGLAGASVRSVQITVAGRRRTTRTTPLAGAEGVRAFAAVLRRPRGGADVVPRVRAYGADARPLAAAVRDCSAAPRAAACAP